MTAVGLTVLGIPVPAAAQDTVGTSFPDDFPVFDDHSLGIPVIGFGAPGPVTRVPVVFLHGNNDSPFPTDCNSFGYIHNFAQYLADGGYRLSELWGLGYQGDQCDLLTNPANKSAEAHSTLANVPDVRRFIHAVLDYTGADQVDVVGHSLGVTVTREWMRQDDAYGLVRTLVGVDGPNHGIINCSPGPRNYFQHDASGGFDPDSAICTEYGSDKTPLLRRLNAGDETPGPTRYVTFVNADRSFVFYEEPDGAFPPCPAEDRTGKPHDFSRSAWLDGALNIGVANQGVYDPILLTAHLGIINSPGVWETTLGLL